MSSKSPHSHGHDDTCWPASTTPRLSASSGQVFAASSVCQSQEATTTSATTRPAWRIDNTLRMRPCQCGTSWWSAPTAHVCASTLARQSARWRSRTTTSRWSAMGPLRGEASPTAQGRTELCSPIRTMSLAPPSRPQRSVRPTVSAPGAVAATLEAAAHTPAVAGGDVMAAPPQQPSAWPAQPPSAVPGADTRGGGGGGADMAVPPQPPSAVTAQPPGLAASTAMSTHQQPPAGPLPAVAATAAPAQQPPAAPLPAAANQQQVVPHWTYDASGQWIWTDWDSWRWTDARGWWQVPMQ